MPALKQVQAISTTYWLVLTLVIEKPSYGYEIAERYARRFGLFLPLRRSVIYSALQALEQAGLLQRLQASPPPVRGHKRMRVNYGPTGEAMAMHKRWLSAPIVAERWRQELLARLGSAHLHDARAILVLLDLYAQHAQRHRQSIEELTAERRAGAQQSLRSLTAMMLLNEQQAAAAAQIEWASRVRSELRSSAGRA